MTLIDFCSRVTFPPVAAIAREPAKHDSLALAATLTASLHRTQSR